MQQFDKISSTKFYALSHDLEFREYEIWYGALQVRPFLIVMETTGFWYNFNYSNSLIQLDLFDGLGNPVSELSEMGWAMRSMEIKDAPGYTLCQTTEFNCLIIDPKGVEYPQRNHGRGFNGLIKAIKLLRKLAQFESIEHFELHQINTDLQKEIELVSGEIKDLEILINQKGA